MRDERSNLSDVLINVFYVTLISLLFFVFLLNNQGHTNVLGFALEEWISLIAILVIPLSITNKFKIRMLSYVILLIPFSYLGIYWTHYSDLQPLVFIFYYPWIILLTIIVSHFILKYLKQISNDSIKMIVIILIAILMVFALLFVIISANNEITEFKKLVTYETLQCSGNSISIDQFDKDCQMLTGKFWEGYYKDMCLRQLQNRRTNGSISSDFVCSYCCKEGYDRIFPPN